MHPTTWGACGSVVFGLTMLLVGSPRAARFNAANGTREPAELSSLRAQANQRNVSGAFEEAAELYQTGYQRSISLRNPRSAMLFLIALGGMRVLTFHYQAALDALLEARRIGEDLSDYASLGMIWTNLSSLYLGVGDLPASRIAAERALSAAAHANAIHYRGQLLAQVGFVHAQAGEAKEAIHYFRQAVEELDNVGDVNTRATILAIIGRQLLQLGDAQAAEIYLNEAFRLQRLFRGRDLRFTYFCLSELRLAQRDMTSAAILIDRAIAMASKADGLAEWLVDRQRGDVHLAENRIPDAVDSYAKALEEAREWREEAAPSDPSGISTDTGLHRLYSAFIEASLRLPHPPIEELFLAVEEDRAAALRREVMLAQSDRKNRDLQYWEKLAKLRASETRLLANETEKNRAEVRQIGFELSELEARERIASARVSGYNGRRRLDSADRMRDIQQRLGESEALLSFYQGETWIYVWAVTREDFEFHRLSNTDAVTRLADRFRRAVQTDARERDELGELLSRELFANLSERVRKKPFWLVTADNTLFEVPLAALVERHGSRPVYLIEQHTIQRISSALMLSGAAIPLRLPTFIGIGDGIYNRADPRWRADKRTKTPIELARLVASNKELRECAQHWIGVAGSSPILLTGVYATREKLEEALKGQKAGAIHIASHILWPSDRPEEALIDFGLTHSGESNVLTRKDIGHLFVPGMLVVMSGCSSAATASVPGAGVTGLVRAWLTAGASVVIGSRWPTPDDSGELFQSFYRWLKDNRAGGSVRAVGEAMRNAQLDMLRSGTWRSVPSYWGAFYVLGKE